MTHDHRTTAGGVAGAVPPALRDLPPLTLNPQFLKACNDLITAMGEACQVLIAEQARIFAGLLDDARAERHRDAEELTTP